MGLYNPHRLWLEVIHQAVKDVGLAVDTDELRKKNEVIRADARTWITGRSADFNKVCEMAGTHPDRIRAMGLRAIAKAEG